MRAVIVVDAMMDMKATECLVRNTQTIPVLLLILTVSDAKFIPVLLSVPVNAGAEAVPSTPEIPVVPSIFKAIIKE